MADSLSVAASITGLVMAGTQIATTVADLEKEVDSLASDSMDVRTRLKWAWAESTLSGLTQRLQNHKASLNLMLSILTCETQAQANQSVQALQALVQQISQQLNQIYLNPHSMQNTLALGHTNVLNASGASIGSSLAAAPTISSASTIRGNYASSVLTIQSSRGSLARGVGSIRSIHSMSSFNYESTLLNTRVYAQALAKPWHAASEAAGWSVMSGRSLAEVSNISVLELPFHAASLSNPWWYDGSIGAESVQVGSISAQSIQVEAEGVQAESIGAQGIQVVAESVQDGSIGAQSIQVEAEGIQVEVEGFQVEAEGAQVLAENIEHRAKNVEWWPHELGCVRVRYSDHVEPINDIIQELDGLPITGFRKPPPIPMDDICWSHPRRWMLDEQSYFVQAVRKGDTRLVRQYLNDGHEINSLLLLYDGVDIEREDLYGNTPLQLASRRRNNKIISLLLDYGADITRCSSKGSINPHRGQSIWLAAQEGHTAAVATVLKHSDASTLLKRCEICQRSPVGECITERAFKTLCFIGFSFSKNGGPEEIRSNLITAAIHTERYFLARELVLCSKSADLPLPKDPLMFHSAIRAGSVELVEAFCSVSAARQDMLDRNGQTPVEAATKLGFSAITQCLLENGFDPEDPSAAESRRFMVAMESGDDRSAVESLNHQLVQDKTDCDTYLRQAVSKGLHKLFMRLIELGAPIDRRDEMGSTVLHVAAAAGDPYIVKLLLMYGWNQNAKDKSGRTALIHAIRAGNHEVSKALCPPMEHTDRLYIPLHQLTGCFD
ncbi:ankyrin repeat-containing domain protein [Morchella snyderi]|nr:ankyrin repeat-containing domain protein [Morchella snyderi]